MKIKQKTQRFGNSPSKLSLNGSARKLRMKEISRENLTMLNRIQRKESHYSLDRMNGERRETEKYLSIISEFPLMGRIKRQMSSTSNGLRKSRKSVTGVTGAAGAAGGKDAGKLLIRQGKIWNGRSFLVEVHKNSDNFRVVAYDLGHPDRHMLHLLPCEVREVCGDEMDLKKLLVRIDLDDGVLAVGPLRPLTSLNLGEGLNGAGGGIGEGV